jgi:type I restriction-modification system DNA methylase subunit
MTAPNEIIDLVERFERQIDSYKSGVYNETQLRREFLDPFFKALGWDVDNCQGYAEAYKDVIHEDAIRIGNATKAPDYCFRIGGARKFFVEAKKPSVDIKSDISPAFQLRRYAFSAKLPLSLLSDFEELAVYDGRFKPVKTDPAATARVFYCTYREYPEKWDYIASIFSRDAILKGSFDKYVESNKSKRGTTEFDTAFLAELDGWRNELARNIALRNSELSQRELNFAVQRVIDRVIFLRICEDRGIEDYGRLRALINADRIYPRLVQQFEDADTRYNSGLFHFQRESGRGEAPDELTPGLDIDDKLLREMLRGLYYPDCPYEFSVISADILGQVYERFLGKIIRLTDGHHAVVDDKPEVKKAGGVYYTPAYIVDYIVRQTLGRLVEGKTPKEVAALRVLDPACGSGSFLIGAYQFLLDWHLDYYTGNEPSKWAKGNKPALRQGGRGWKLTIDERKRILINNIHGVDIDSQAVEVTKLSLLLKVLEGETGQTLQTLLRFFNERALPDLGNNIKCGNSLIGPDFYDQSRLPFLSDEERYRLNVFDWRAEFPNVFQSKARSCEMRDAATPLDYTQPGVPLHGSYSRKKVKTAAVPSPAFIEPDWEGGFDAVIGNPPYVRIQGFPKEEIDYFSSRFQSATGNYDLYVNFIERGFKLLKSGGLLGFIVPNKFLRTDYGEGLRRMLSTVNALSRIVDFGASQVFAATTYTCLLFLDRDGSESFDHALSEASPKALLEARFSKRRGKSLGLTTWTFENEEAASLLSKLQQGACRLLDLPARMSRGSSSGDDGVFVFETGTLDIEPAILREPLFATDFGRYDFAVQAKWRVIFPYVLEGGKYRLYTETEMRTGFPRAFKHLEENQPRLKKRKQFRQWHGYSAARNLDLHDNARIAVPLLADRGLCALIPKELRGKLCPMAGGGFTISLDQQCKLAPEYVLGLLNSKLLFWRLRMISNVFRGGWITCTKQYFGELPIRLIDFALPADALAHDRMVKLVTNMLDLNKRQAVVRTPQEKTALERQIAATDSQIDRLVYELYGLTEKEIRAVEEFQKS